jgi:hypothetical protein
MYLKPFNFNRDYSFLINSFYFLSSSILVYDWYLLRKQLEHAHKSNIEFKNTLELINSKYLQLESQLNALQSNSNISTSVSTNVWTNNAPNLDVNFILYTMGFVFVFCILAGTSYSLCTDTNFLNTSAGKIFIDNNSSVKSVLNLNNVKYDLLTTIDFKNSTVSYCIKKAQYPDALYINLEDFISCWETSTSSLQSVDSNTILNVITAASGVC